MGKNWSSGETSRYKKYISNGLYPEGCSFLHNNMHYCRSEQEFKNKKSQKSQKNKNDMVKDM